jgi:hypothetical protein
VEDQTHDSCRCSDPMVRHRHRHHRCETFDEHCHALREAMEGNPMMMQTDRAYTTIDAFLEEYIFLVTVILPSDERPGRLLLCNSKRMQLDDEPVELAYQEDGQPSLFRPLENEVVFELRMLDVMEDSVYRNVT